MPKRLRANLAAIRARGYAIDDEEHAIGLRCVAAPIFDEHGAPAAGLSLSGPSARLTPDRLPALGGLAAAIAGELTHETGGLPAAEIKSA